MVAGRGRVVRKAAPRPARSRRAGSGRARASVSLLLALCLAAGAASGSRSGARLRARCELDLLPGEEVVVEGRSANRTFGPSDPTRPGRPDAATGSRVRRIALRDAWITSDAGRCPVRELAVYPREPTGPVHPGLRLRLTGRWLRFAAEQGRWPVPGGRAGIVVDARRADGDGAAPADRPTVPGARLPERARGWASARLSARLPGDVRPLSRALLLAERDELSGEVKRRFAAAGLAHLLAISGLHVGILAALVVSVVGPVVRGRWRHALPPVLVGTYVALIGAPAAAVRAGLVFAGWSWGRFRGRPVRAGDLFAGAALLALAVDPGLLVDPGFQLSFAGFAGVIAGGRAGRRLAELAASRHAGRGGLARRAARAGRSVSVALAASAGAFLATAPIVAAHFGRVAPASLLSHLGGTPLVALSLTGLVATFLPGPAGRIGADAATWALRVLDRYAALVAGWPGASGPVAAPDALAWATWLAGWTALLVLAARPTVRRLAVPVGLTLALLIGGSGLRRLGAGADALLCTLSVGQGDAAILRTFGGSWIAFDGGPQGEAGPGRDGVLAALHRHGARSVTLAVLSHPDLDHAGGLLQLVSRLRVGGLLDGGIPLPRPAYAALLAGADERGIRWIEGRAGTRVAIDGVELLVLAPPPDTGAARPPRSAGANASSLVVRVDIGGFRYLNPGDATSREEESVLAAWPAESLRADLLKVGHHGSRTSTSAGWLSAVRPVAAVISAGAANRYGHPHPEVLARLEDAGVAEVWRTDRSGTICLQVSRDGRWRLRGESAWRAARAVGTNPGTELESGG